MATTFTILFAMRPVQIPIMDKKPLMNVSSAMNTAPPALDPLLYNALNVTNPLTFSQEPNAPIENAMKDSI